MSLSVERKLCGNTGDVVSQREREGRKGRMTNFSAEDEKEDDSDRPEVSLLSVALHRQHLRGDIGQSATGCIHSFFWEKHLQTERDRER
jgi:hypothetical protein